MLRKLGSIQFTWDKPNKKKFTKKRQKTDCIGDSNKGGSVNASEEYNEPIKWWKKKSIFFMLPYWKHNLLHHNLDVMYIKKNIYDNVIGTLLHLESKSKNN